MTDKKTGLVLSGGGAKGYYQAQIVKILEDHGYEWDVVVGVSVGALNGSLISTGKTERLLDVWRDLRNEDIYTGGHSLWRYLEILLKWKRAVYDNDPLERLIKREYDPSKTETPFVSGAVSLKNERYIRTAVNPDDFPAENLQKERVEYLQKMVLASSIIPGTWRPRTVGSHEKLVDGGVRNVTPLADALSYDVDEIIIVPTNRIFDTNTHNDPKNIIQDIKTSVKIMLDEIIKGDVITALRVNDLVQQSNEPLYKPDGSEYKYLDLHLLEPERSLGKGMDFQSDSAKRLRRNEGRKVAKKFLTKKKMKPTLP